LAVIFNLSVITYVLVAIKASCAKRFKSWRQWLQPRTRLTLHVLLCFVFILYILWGSALLLLLLLSAVSSLCRVSTLVFLRQTMCLGNTVLQLFWC